VLEGILNDVATARNVQPFRVALMAIYSVSFVHAAVYVTLFFYSGPAAKTLSSVAMKIIVALYLANGSSTGKRRILADIWPPLHATHSLSRKPYYSHILHSCW